MLAFAAFAAVLTVTPGLDTMLVLRTTAVAGRRAGAVAVAGIATGCMIWAVASAVGVSAVLATSRPAFEVLRAAGVIYLTWLGARVLWHARRDGTSTADPDLVSPAPLGGGGVRAFRTGLASNLLNPKTGAFYLSVMPPFLPEGLNPLVGALALGAIHVVEGIVWLGLLVVVVNWARAWLTRTGVRRRLEQLSGLAFVGFGVRLALEPAPR